MSQVLLFVEHELDLHEQTSTLAALAALPLDEVQVRVLVPYHGHTSIRLMDEIAASRGAPAGSAVADLGHDTAVARSQAQRILEHALAILRPAGYPARGEVVATRDQVTDLVAEASAAGAEATLIVASPHRLEHVLHRDLAHRLRHAGLAHVVSVDGVAGQRAPE